MVNTEKLTYITFSREKDPSAQERKEFLKVNQPANKKTHLIALACFFALGMFFSYIFAPPWLVTFTFFALTIAPMFRLGRILGVDLKNRIY